MAARCGLHHPYGDEKDAIRNSILDGRPKGMPSFRSRLTDEQAWQLAAYIRSIGGKVRKDALPGRRDGMAATPPPSRTPPQPPRAETPQ